MKSVSRLVLALLLGLSVQAAALATMDPQLPCDRQVYMFGGSQLVGDGLRDPDNNKLSTRVRTFFRRVCGKDVRFKAFGEEDGRLLEEVGEIVAQLAVSPRSIAIIHYPLSDIEHGARVDQLLAAYAQILSACAQSQSLCVIGGQQPVNSFSDGEAHRQQELEHKAAERFDDNFVPLYRVLSSRVNAHRLMTPLDSGDGRLIGDRGHQIVFQLYRRRLLELTAERS